MDHYFLNALLTSAKSLCNFTYFKLDSPWKVYLYYGSNIVYFMIFSANLNVIVNLVVLRYENLILPKSSQSWTSKCHISNM